MKLVIKRAVKAVGATKRVSKAAVDYLAELAGGDARLALNNLELALNLAQKVTPDVIKTAAQKRLPSYDKKGDMHYNVVSAFIKSLRGSDVDAALYYMARMLQAGEDPKFIARRMVVFASEDIGLAGNGAVGLAVDTFAAVERVGMPECEYSLYHCATALARAKKSREVVELKALAKDRAAKWPEVQVPMHLRNAPTKLMKGLGYGKSYEKYPGANGKKFLPEEVK
jgi:putative ATPase